MSGDGLARSLGLPAMTANTVNCIVGSGIFLLPALVAAILGPGWLIAYVICAVAIMLVFLSLAEAASRVSQTGGTYRFVDVAFGPYAGMLLGAVLWFSNVASSAAVAVLFAVTVGVVVPPLAAGIGRAAVIIAMYAALTAINIRDVRNGAAVVIIVTIAKIAPLVVLILGGLIALHGQHVPVSGRAPWSDVGRAALILFYAFTGIEVALQPAGEVTDPARTMPRAVLLALVIITALYIGTHYVAQGILGPGLAADQVAPLASTADHIFGPRGRALMLAAAALSTFAYVSGDILASPRLVFAFARDGYLPAIVGKIHPRHGTPYIAIAVYATIACGLALTGTYKVLVVLASLAAVLIYLASCLALLVLRKRDLRTAGRPFLVPGGPTIPLLACIVLLWLGAQATRGEYKAIGLVLAAATILYVVRATVTAVRTRSAPSRSDTSA
jgi:basic amino acid/polyamine antiporter, APA family